MAFTIIEQMEKPGPSLFYNPKFRHILEMHMKQLRTRYAIRHQILPEELYQFEGDFCGFLLSKGKELEMHWLMTRINGMNNPSEFGKGLRDPYPNNIKYYYLEPNPDALAELQQYWITLQP